MAQKQRRSWGSVTKLDKNVYRIRYWGDKRDGKGYRRLSKTIHGTRREAENEMAKLRVSNSEDAPCPTLKQAYELWWLPAKLDAIKKGTLKESSMYIYQCSWKSVVSPEWGDCILNSLSPLQIQAWLSTLQRTQGKRALALMRQIIDFAVLYEVVEYNVADKPYVLSNNMRKCDAGIYTLNELIQILDIVQGSAIEVPYILAAFGSCRASESLGATIEDVTEQECNGFKFAVVNIDKQITNIGEVKHTLKNHQSKRFVVIPPPISERIFAAQKKSDNWLAHNEDGSVVSYNQLKVLWKKLMDSQKAIPVHPFANLRNSWRTFMAWDLKIPAEKLEKMMGHAGRGVGEIYYNRPTANMFVEAYGEALSKNNPFNLQ